MAFQKGKSGNPGGRPKDKAWASAVRLAVNRVHDGDKEGRKKLIVLAEKLAEFALAGEGWAFREIGDRLDGKPQQSVDVSVSNVPATQLGDDELANIAAGGSEDAAEPPLDPAQLN